ncbi:sulfatase-like hydrolase/transferase [Paenibacillus doosanensis]|uniref:sulfatase-like hydrolase/transferase n=1 Tax=Paenibacillus doosanensis TaxID=1229154 RepID=UPI00217FC641|nr:sulfatase-like hydrolase/transferase [Paenibacillus doosanensis]MCS7462824.1 sulfatase-like hydrolase/transferase [Paenibacillus doosanensis]
MTGSRKNIVIIMSDEQSWDTLGCHGNAASVTPNIDALAARGTSLDRCYTAYPLCCPARASLWTGLMPHGHEVTGNWRSIREDLRDEGLVKNFKEAGFHTIYTGKWHVPGTTPDRFHFDDISAIPAVIEGRDRGRFIEEYREYARSEGYVLHDTHIENLTHADLEKLNRPGRAPYGTAEIKEEHFLETWQTRQFLQAMDRRPEEQPFLAVCSYNAPHFPMIVPSPYDKLVRPEDVTLPENFLKGIEGKPQEVLNSPYFKEMQGLDESEWRGFIAHYWGLCALIDKQVGEIVGYLKRNGLFDNTIIVFVSDHGDMMGAHGIVKKGFPLHYEEALRVPLIIANAGASEASAPSESAALVSLIDLLPTLADLSGVAVKQRHEGRSFEPVLQGKTDRHRDYVVAETFKLGGDEGAIVGGERVSPRQFRIGKDSVNVSVRTDTHKYIFRYMDEEELYDLTEDPYENVNIAGDRARTGEIAHMRELLRRELADSHPFLGRLIAGRLDERNANAMTTE